MSQSKTSWLDRVLATPTIGLRVQQSFGKSIERRSRILGITFDRMLSENEKIRIDREDSREVTFYCSERECNFTLTKEDVVVQFRYSSEQEREAGGLPMLKKKDIRAHGELLDEVENEFSLLLKDILGGEKIGIVRIGIMSSVNMREDVIPPGVKKFIDKIGSPWHSRPIVMNIDKILIQLSKEKEHHDQCHHKCVYDTTSEDKSYHIVLDWQRVFDSKKEIGHGLIMDEVALCRKTALDYFERFAEWRIGGE